MEAAGRDLHLKVLIFEISAGNLCAKSLLWGILGSFQTRISPPITVARKYPLHHSISVNFRVATSIQEDLILYEQTFAVSVFRYRQFIFRNANLCLKCVFLIFFLSLPTRTRVFINKVKHNRCGSNGMCFAAGAHRSQLGMGLKKRVSEVKLIF